ncbi:MAG: FMN-binding protein, partial [Fusobacterium sp.]
MKKLFTSVLFLLISAFVFASGIVTTSGTGDGFSGKIKVDVVTNGEKIEDIRVVSNSETSHIISRAFPILKERILKAQSPIVDSVSGASYTSFGVKMCFASYFSNKLQYYFPTF